MIEISDHIRDILNRLPEQPGVYQHINNDGEIIYVGKAKNLKRRVSSYFQKDHDSYKTKLLVRNIVDIKYIVVASEQDAFLLENNLIKKYQPHYNILLKDGKSYPSICITKEPYPRVFKTRKIIKGIGEYYGPFSYGNTVDLVLDLAHELYPIRTCHLNISDDSIKQKKHKICLKYHIHNCCGICEGLISKHEYLDYIECIRKIVKGDAHEIAKSFELEMDKLASELKFEEAAEIKRKYDLIEKFNSRTIIARNSVKDALVVGYEENGKEVYISMLNIHNGCIIQGQVVEYQRNMDDCKEEIIAHGILELLQRLNCNVHEILVPFMPDGLENHFKFSTPKMGDKKQLLDLAMKNVQQYKLDKIKQGDKLNPDQRAIRVLTKLKDMLNLPKLPIYIDSFDNSNIQGTNAVAACVVFKMAKPSKKDYKKFSIQTVEGQDDYASMREIVYRRYRRILDENGELPDMIIADGGIGQMHAIRDVIEDNLHLSIPIVGLVKNDKHRTNTLLYGFPPQEFGMKPTDEIFQLMTRIQDEVHRFAISYHKQRRSKNQTASELDEIKGIGFESKKRLISTFKSVKQLSLANLEDIVKIVGKSRGSIVYEHFHGKISV